jgi:DNA polymerase III subunit gamma/tau
MSVLYRKYRPQTFNEVVGQEHVKKILSQEIKRGEVGHAFLFMGPRGIGKTTLARILAKALNCLNRKEGEFEPCNECNNCRAVNENRDLDIIEIDAASHTGVDNVRENIISVSRIAAAPNKHKVFIIDEIHMLSPSAFNALLKTLEEPPKNVVFILATTEIHKVPQTIISRCQRFDFKKIDFNDIVARLNRIIDNEKVKVDKEVLESIAYNSEGCLRDAESLLTQILSLDENEITKDKAELVLPSSDINLIFSLVEYLFTKNSKEAIKIINESVNSGIDLSRLTQNLIELYRKILLIKINPELNEFTKEFDEKNKEKIFSLVQKLEEDKIFKTIDVLNKRLSEIKSSKIPQLPMELAVVEICLLSGGVMLVEDEIKKEGLSAGEAKSRIEPGKQVKIQDIQFIWSRIIEDARKHNNSLSSFLQSSQLRNFNGTILTLASKHEFNQKKLNEVKNKGIVESLLRENLGIAITINPTLDKDISNVPTVEANGEILDSLNEVFGDELEK